MNMDSGAPPILVIDDEASLLSLLEKCLTKYGFNVDPAESGEKGIQKLDMNQYSLILTDIKMPGISGRQVLNYVKANKGNSVPVVGMSGTPWLLEDTEFDAVLAKPFPIQKVVGMITSLLKDKPSV